MNTQTHRFVFIDVSEEATSRTLMRKILLEGKIPFSPFSMYFGTQVLRLMQAEYSFYRRIEMALRQLVLEAGGEELSDNTLTEDIPEHASEKFGWSPSQLIPMLDGNLQTNPLVVIESPYKGTDWSETEFNVAYLCLCMRHYLSQGYTPYASHGLFTQPGVLDDKNREERKLGIGAGLTFGNLLLSNGGQKVVMRDLGVSEGVIQGVEDAQKNGFKVKLDSLPDELFNAFCFEWHREELTR